MPQVTKESFARALQALIRKYEGDRDTYLSSQYNEAQTRTQFISPLLEGLGWDVRNEAGVPYNQCEVLEEKGETHGRPDYTFRLNGQTKFFLEAKSPSPALPTNDIIQTKRYAWNSRDVFFAGVCDFEQFRFFDASLRPDEKRPYDGEAFHLIFSEYASNIDKLWELSRDRVAAGSLDQFLRKDRKSLLQKVPVDKDFLDNLTTWRHDLANAIHARSPEHDAHALNDIVQRLLDRIIFIRIAEERKVIDQRELWDIAVIWEESGGRRNIMEQLVQVFQEFNTRFNGEIFKPHPCEEIKIESLTLVKIIKQLYPPKSNYRFDVIGVELLGSIYERYLGNTLRITPKRVFLEPKPEVRKAGGVYYTPKYIVDYIVKNTVGKLVEDKKTPKEVDKIRILDPACGSGSFLIGAFQFLIDWHLDYYREHPKEAVSHGLVPMTRTDQDGNLRLSFYAKSLILQHNLYGVDIDPQAVEVTMMSLYLKMLEDELGIQIPKQDKLPELKYNIRCGNSLIAPDIEKFSPLPAEERERIRAFDWHSREDGFGDILASGGFDCVIANPPYVQIENIPSIERNYFVEAYGENGKLGKRYDIYQVFVLRALSLLRYQGHFGYILPNTFLMGRSYRLLRKRICDMARVEQCVDLPQGVFQGVTVDNVLLFLQSEQGVEKRAMQAIQVHKLAPKSDKTRVQSEEWDESFTIIQGELTQDEGYAINVHTNPQQAALFRKLEAVSLRLGDITESSQGIILYRTESQAQKAKYTGTKREVGWKKLLRGTNIARYEMKWGGEYVHYGPWLWCAREEKFFARPKILLQALRNKSLERRLIATYDAEKHYNAHNLANIIAKEGSDYDLPYVLACFNSTLLNSWYKAHFPNVNINPNDFREIPIRRICLSDPNEKTQHDRIVTLVERMLGLNKKKHSGKLALSELERLKREIAATDAEIDSLVYDLYGITDEERKIIEAAE